MTIERRASNKRLGAWLVRVSACAAPSLLLATINEYTRVADLVAMASGIAGFAILFSHLDARALPEHRWARRAFIRSAWMKTTWTAAGMLFFAVRMDVTPLWLRWSLSFSLYLDALIGSGLTSVVGRGEGFLDRYFTTLLTTLLQGTAIGVELWLLVLAQALLRRRTRRDPFR